MKRFKVLYIKYGIQRCECFNESHEAIEFAIGKILENYDTKVIDNQTGKVFEETSSLLLDRPCDDCPLIEIVKCKDCTHSKEWYRDRRLCYLWAEVGVPVFESGYCSYGERRADEI